MKNETYWKQRFNNFEKAFLLLQDIIEKEKNFLALESIVKEGIVQRFNYTFELAWKTLKDKLVFDGINLELISPKYVFKTAFAAKYIENIEIWISMVNDRNLMSHTYDKVKLNNIITNISKIYYFEIKSLYLDLKKAL